MTTVTLAQVAERAGVSTATVSMVLRNRGRISQATRDRVLKALDDAGYVYNQTAANLRNRSSNQVGLLLHDITNPFYGEMTAGLSHEMERHDLLLFLASNKGRVFTKKQIYTQVWAEEYAFDDSNIMSFISKLRKKIEPNPEQPFYIQTVRGVGYRFNKEA